jgi:hypothetical protein
VEIVGKVTECTATKMSNAKISFAFLVFVFPHRSLWRIVATA